MSPRVLLVDIGSAAPELPVVTPPEPRPPSSWTPNPRPSPGLAPPTGLAVAAIADAAVLSWTRSTAPGATTVIESAPDNAGVPGVWREVDRTGAESYTLALPGGARWVRVRAELNGRTSVATNAVLAALRSSEDLEQSIADLVEDQLQQDQALADEILARQQEDARVATEAASDAAAKVQAEAQQRADDLLNERLAWTAAVELANTLRESGDSSLAQSLAQVSAGSGQQFDPVQIWRFDTTPEGWSGNGAPTIVDGWLRPANHASDPYVVSPDDLGVDGSAYRYAKLRIKKVGNPTWRGWLRWITTTDATFNTAKQSAIPEPEFDANGIATVDWSDLGWWPATIRRLRLHLSTAQTATDHFLIDWVAIGRPTPGAGVALVQAIQQALQTADSNEALARETLAAQMRGTYTGTDVAQVTQGLIFSERQARSSAIGAEAEARQAIAAKVDDPETGLSKAHSRITEVGETAAAENAATLRRVEAAEVRLGAAGTIDLPNPSFEEDHGWTLPAGVGYSTLRPNTGARALAFDGPTIGGANVISANAGRTRVRVGEKLRVGAFMARGGTAINAAARVHVAIRGYDSNGAQVPGSPSAVVNELIGSLPYNYSAGLKSGEYTVPAGATTVEVYLSILNHTEGTLFVDDVILERVTISEMAHGQAIDSINLAIDQQDDFIQGVADHAEAIELRLDDPNTGLGSKASVVQYNQIKGRIDNTGGGRSIEQLASALVSVENQLPGKVSTQAFNALDTYTRETLAGEVQANAGNISGVRARTAGVVDLRNPSFETSDGWSLPTGVSYSTARVRTGARSLKLAGAETATSGNVPNSGRTAVRVGERLRVGAHIARGGLASDAGARIQIAARCYDIAGAYVPASSVAVVNEWANNFPYDYSRGLVSGEYVVPEGAATVEVYVSWSNHTVGDVYVDDVVLERVTATDELAAAVTQLLRADVNSVTGKVNASYTINLNANGYHSGVIAQNNGQVSSWRFQTDTFGIYNTSGAGLSWTDGTLWNARGTVSMISGPTLGDGMTFYIGPTPISPAQARRADAVFSVNADGAKVKGLLEGSLLDTGALSRNSTRIHTGNGRLAPFVIKAGGYASGGAPANRNIDVANIISPDHLSGYHFRRMAWRKSDVFLEAHVSGDGGDETLQLYVAYDGGAWELIASVTVPLGNRSAFPLLVRYTTKTTNWNVVSFNCRTTQGRTYALAFKVEVDNFNESSNAAHSNSGTNPGGDVGGTPPSAGNGGGNDGGFRPGFTVVVP